MATAVAKAEKNEVIALPAGFGEVTYTPPEQNRLPYVKIVYERGVADLVGHIKDLKAGEPVFIPPEPAVPTVLRPMRYFLLQGKQFWAPYSGDGAMLDYSDVEKDFPFIETAEALILVVVKDKLHPATIRVKGTSFPALKNALTTLPKAKTKAWLEQGEDYQATATIPQPFFRFTTTASKINANRKDAEKIKKLGASYPTFESTINPTSAAEYKMCLAFLSSKADMDLLTKVTAHHHKRLEDAAKKAKKEVAAS